MIAAAFVGAAVLGGLIRWQSHRLNAATLPYGTLGVNLVAAFAAGLAGGVSATAALLVTTAFLGSMSTFSTVVAEVDAMARRGATTMLATYLVLTIVGGVALAGLGLALA